jgi:hypothetical protein
MPSLNIIERALQLAPKCSSVKELREHLRKEGYEQVNAHLSGLGFRRELQKLFNDGVGQKKRGPSKLR